MKILAVTTTRADWGLLAPLLKQLEQAPEFDLVVLVTGQHHMDDRVSRNAILSEGFERIVDVDIGLTTDDSPLALSEAMSKALLGVAKVLDAEQPDLMVVLGDRYEQLPIASAALMAKVPVAHLCGGDITEGAIDDAVRHALTKLSAIHFPTTEDAAKRVRQLGEDPARVFNVGSTGLDRVREVPRMPADAFWESVGLKPRARNIVVTFHPPTLADDTEAQVSALLQALAGFPQLGMIFTGSNADPGGKLIDRRIQDFVDSAENAVFHTSLGSQRYFSALTYCDAVVGNSSSGLYEAPSFGLATVNIGDRQDGRLRAASVLDCPADAAAISDALRNALVLDCSEVNNPYGDGHSAERIVRVLADLQNHAALTRKKFQDLKT